MTVNGERAGIPCVDHETFIVELLEVAGEAVAIDEVCHRAVILGGFRVAREGEFARRRAEWQWVRPKDVPRVILHFH